MSARTAAPKGARTAARRAEVANERTPGRSEGRWLRSPQGGGFHMSARPAAPKGARSAARRAEVST